MNCRVPETRVRIWWKATPAPVLLVRITRSRSLSSSGRDASISPSVDSFTKP